MRHHVLKRGVTVVAAVFVLASCGDDETAEFPEPIRALKTYTVAEVASGQVQRYSGIVQATDTSALSFQVSGNVREVKAEIGQSVSKGQVLASLDPKRYELDVSAARAELQKAQADFNQKKLDLSRQTELYQKKWIAKAALDQAVSAFEAARSNVDYATSKLDRAQRDLANTVLRAPFDGLIAAKSVDPFTEVQAGQTLFEINAAGALEVALDVPETLIPRIHPGLPVTVRFSAARAVIAGGRVTKVSSVAGAANAFPVTASLIDPPDVIRPGMTAEVDILVGEASTETAYLVPLTAIASGDAPRTGYVFKFDAGSSTVKKVAITARGARNNLIEVTDGVAPGDVIASAGVSFLSDGQKVKLMNR